MVSAVNSSINAAILTGAPVASTLFSGKSSALSKGSLASLTGGSLLSASLGGGGLDVQSLLQGATGLSLSPETQAALNKALESNPYSQALTQTSTAASLYSSLSGASSLYNSTLNMLTNAYAQKLPNLTKTA